MKTNALKVSALSSQKWTSALYRFSKNLITLIAVSFISVQFSPRMFAQDPSSYPPPSCHIKIPDPLPECGSSGNKLCASTSDGIVSYVWTVKGEGWAITDGQGTSCITYTAGSDGTMGTFILKVKNKYGYTCKCWTCFHCAGEGCTPGFWKNATTYWDEAGDAVSSCVASAIAAKGGSYSGDGTTGSLFRTTFGLTAEQMVAAGLNPDLTLLQAISLGGGGCQKLARHATAALLNSCGLKSYGYSTGQVLTKTHNSIADNACEPTATKFATANETSTCPLSSDGNADHAIAKTFGPSDINKVSVKAYPNPYSGQVNFRIIPPVSGDARLEVYDMLGKKLAVIYRGDIEKGVERAFTYTVPAGNKVAMIYKLTVGSQTVHGILTPQR